MEEELDKLHFEIQQAVIEMNKAYVQLTKARDYLEELMAQSHQTQRAAGTAPRCPKCGSPLLKDETRERSYICSKSGACR